MNRNANAENSNEDREDAHQSKYWYMIVSFVVAVIFSTVYVYVLIKIRGWYSLSGSFLSLWLFGLLFLGLSTYPALVKDTAFLRQQDTDWHPKSWYFFLFGLGAPFLGFFTALIRYPLVTSLALATVGFIVFTFLFSLYHLYRRWKHY